MSQRVSTAGMILACVVGPEDTRPTSGYKEVPEIKSMPSFNPAPNMIDSTTLKETEYMTYVKGLKDLGSSLEYTANLTDDLMDFWNNVITNHETAVAAGNTTWFAVIHPDLKYATFFTGEPSPIGFNEASVGAMAETTLYITPNTAPVLADKPTVGP